jgi:hypothetical protein
MVPQSIYQSTFGINRAEMRAPMTASGVLHRSLTTDLPEVVGGDRAWLIARTGRRYLGGGARYPAWSIATGE